MENLSKNIEKNTSKNVVEVEKTKPDETTAEPLFEGFLEKPKRKHAVLKIIGLILLYIFSFVLFVVGVSLSSQAVSLTKHTKYIVEYNNFYRTIERVEEEE